MYYGTFIIEIGPPGTQVEIIFGADSRVRLASSTLNAVLDARSQQQELFAVREPFETRVKAQAGVGPLAAQQASG